MRGFLVFIIIVITIVIIPLFTILTLPQVRTGVDELLPEEIFRRLASSRFYDVFFKMMHRLEIAKKIGRMFSVPLIN